MNKKILKSIWAVFSGFVTVVLLSVTTDFILESLGIFPPPDQGFFIPWMVVLALVYRTLYTVLGGYVTAMLAPNKPMWHVMVLAAIGCFAGILGLVATWGKGLGPEWYPIALVVLAIPSVWFGGKLRKKKSV